MNQSNSGIPYLNISGAPRLPVIRQTLASECGLACVAMIANYLGVGADLVELRKQHSPSLSGATLRGISQICAGLQLSTRAISCRVTELRELRTPCLLHWRFDHFVVLKSANRSHLVIHDPARGVVSEPYDQVAEAFTGVALEVSRAPGFTKTRPPPRLALSGLLTFDRGSTRTLAGGMLLALICELLVLAAPLYLQIVIDQVLGKGDVLLLNTLAVGFGALLAFQVISNTMRLLIFQYLSHVFVFDMTARILHKLLRLPLAYFRGRDLGDVQHRVQSLRRVQNFIVNSAPAALLDAVFIVLVVGLMTAYDRSLTLLAIAVAVTWCGWRAAVFPLGLRYSNDIAQSESSVETHFLETLRAVQTVKLVNGESTRLSEWRNLFAGTINSKIKAGNLGALDSAIRQLLFQGLRIACIYLLAHKALEGRMSIGAVSAFVAYLGMFITRAGGIVNRALEYKLLQVPLDRLADIVFIEEEAVHPANTEVSDPSLGIEIRHVAFTYAAQEPWVLKDCSCFIPQNGFVAIAGCSGTGKSTLLRLIAGVDSISDGEIVFDGVAISDWGTLELRRAIATVFQEDCLVKGSLADNIALFDAEPVRERVRWAAAKACIAAEIERLPMGYESRIGDLGSSLSKGQIQRVLLARAFYRRPRLLLLDEATSGLDLELERRVIRSIVDFDATRLVVTHSDCMLEAADTVVWLHDGRLLSSRPELNV